VGSIANSYGDENSKAKRHCSCGIMRVLGMNGIKLFVLVVLCLQNSVFTLLRRYSLGVLKEKYSKFGCLALQSTYLE